MLALKANNKDNVATIFGFTKKDDVVKVSDPKGDAFKVSLLQEIPYAHKVAIDNIKKGESIIKYGEEIGKAIKEIKVGDYVHVHNLESNRGRGDLCK